MAVPESTPRRFRRRRGVRPAAAERFFLFSPPRVGERRSCRFILQCSVSEEGGVLGVAPAWLAAAHCWAAGPGGVLGGRRPECPLHRVKFAHNLLFGVVVARGEWAPAAPHRESFAVPHCTSSSKPHKGQRGLENFIIHLNYSKVGGAGAASQAWPHFIFSFTLLTWYCPLGHWRAGCGRAREEGGGARERGSHLPP